MTVGIDELQRLIAKYVSTGAAVVVVLLGPGQAPSTGEGASTGGATTVTVAPGSATSAPTTPPASAPRSTEGPTRPGTTTTPGSTTAADTRGWGAPTRSEDFDGGLDGWQVYDGTGHAGRGRRSPSALTVRDGVLTITGDAAGTTGGMSWGRGQRYGRWEARVRAPAADPSYDAVLLLWPDAENWPRGGEVDFMEMGDPARRSTDGFVHHGADNRQLHAAVRADATAWHNWAVEWTPSSITMFLDGRAWFRTTDPAAQPPGPMHLCVQLDWFPQAGTPVRRSAMQVDRVRQYALGEGLRGGTDPAGEAGD